MGLLTLYLQERARQKAFEEQKRQFGERQKLDKAQAEINKQTSERLMADFMERVSSKYQPISPTVTSPEGERTQHPFLQETGIAPDFSRAVFGEGKPQVQVDKPMFGDWYKGLQERRKGETAHEYKMKEIEHTQKMQAKFPEKTTTSKAEQVPAYDSRTGKSIMVDINNPNLSWSEKKQRYEFVIGKKETQKDVLNTTIGKMMMDTAIQNFQKENRRPPNTQELMKLAEQIRKEYEDLQEEPSEFEEYEIE